MGTPFIGEEVTQYKFIYSSTPPGSLCAFLLSHAVRNPRRFSPTRALPNTCVLWVKVRTTADLVSGPNLAYVALRRPSRDTGIRLRTSVRRWHARSVVSTSRWVRHLRTRCPVMIMVPPLLRLPPRRVPTLCWARRKPPTLKLNVTVCLRGPAGWKRPPLMGSTLSEGRSRLACLNRGP